MKHKGTYIVRFKSKTAYFRLLALGANKSRLWRVPLTIFPMNDGLRKIFLTNWIRAYFDDEAHVDLSTRRIAVTSVNSKGIEDVKNILKELGIHSKIYNIMKGYARRLVISRLGNIEKYSLTIGFKHPRKSRKLNELLKLYTKTYAI